MKDKAEHPRVLVEQYLATKEELETLGKELERKQEEWKTVKKQLINIRADLGQYVSLNHQCRAFHFTKRVVLVHWGEVTAKVEVLKLE